MTATLYQCVPNFSEGRRQDVLTALAEAITQTPDVCLLDYSADADHNRSVFTFLGEAQPVRTAALAVARIAVERIDLRTHSGVHPRTGAIDVLPVVPLHSDFTPKPEARWEAVALAREMGNDLAQYLTLPVYFYEWAAQEGKRSALPELRKGGFEAFQHRELVGDYAPDLGPNRVHPTAGMAVVGARGPLVAYNINLATPDRRIARAIASHLREERTTRPELTGVRALGLALASQGRSQVSLNLTEPHKTPLPALFAYIARLASEYGAEAIESEIIGVIPQAALAGQSPESIRWNAYKPMQILENWQNSE